MTNGQANLKPHRLSELLPLMSDAEFQSLKADIAANGQRDPVELFEGKILDGRNRHRACVELKIDPITRPFKGNESQAVALVYSRANHRNMSDSQKACAAVNFLPHFETLAASRRHGNLRSGTGSTSGGVSSSKLVSGKTRAQMQAILRANGPKELERKRELHAPKCFSWSSRDVVINCILDRMYGPEESPPAAGMNGKSRDLAGTLFGVSGRYVQDAKLIFEQDKKLFQQCFEGTLPITRAKTLVKRAARVAHLNALHKSGRMVHPEDATIIVGESPREMKKLPGRKFRLVFVDPPYNLGFSYDADPTGDRLPPQKYIAWIRACLVEAHRVLTADGAICIMICEEWVDYFGLALRAVGFHLRRLIVWHESFGQAGNKNFGRTCRFIWYAVKDLDAFVFDETAALTSSKRATMYADKRAMPGGKVLDALWDFSRLQGTSNERLPDDGIPTQLPVALVDRAIRIFTDPGDEVLDFCGGTGTTLRAALSSGRKCTYIDRSKKYAAIAKRELALVSSANGKGS